MKIQNKQQREISHLIIHQLLILKINIYKICTPKLHSFLLINIFLHWIILYVLEKKVFRRISKIYHDD